MKVQPVVKRDTLRLAVGMVAPVVLTVLAFGARAGWIIQSCWARCWAIWSRWAISFCWR